jgi:hypothetical protein
MTESDSDAPLLFAIKCVSKKNIVFFDFDGLGAVTDAF